MWETNESEEESVVTPDPCPGEPQVTRSTEGEEQTTADTLAQAVRTATEYRDVAR